MQKITDTIDFLDKEAELYAPEAQPPQFARQMDYNEQQLRRMQLNDQEAVATNLRGPLVGDGEFGFLVTSLPQQLYKSGKEWQNLVEITK